MTRAKSTLAAATAGLGLAALASTSAKAFVPLVAAAIIGGAALGGAALGSAANNSYYYPYSYPTVAAPAPVVVAPAPAPVATLPAPTEVVTGPSVAVNSTTCYITHRWLNGVRHRIRVCNTVSP
jgi:hypothetical protein